MIYVNVEIMRLKNGQNNILWRVTMYKLTKYGLTDSNDELIVYVNAPLLSIKKNIEIEDEKIIHLQNELAYFTITDVYLGELSGTCKILFKSGILIQIKFLPSMKRYTCGLDKITRQILYACVYKAYQEINDFFRTLKFELCIQAEKKSFYIENHLQNVVCIDNNNESVCVIQEVIDE